MKEEETVNPPLVTAYIYVSRSLSTESDDCKEMIKRLEGSHITVKLMSPDDGLEYADSKCPRAYFTVGPPDWTEFKTLGMSPPHERRRWVHKDAFSDIDASAVFWNWLGSTDPLPRNKEIPPTSFSSDVPLVSVFTPAYRSGERIKRPYRSLLAQTYPNWEWVIVDDSGDGDKTYNECILPLKDPRIKKFRQEQRSGYIGTVKRAAAGLCTGEILVEVDHDDDLSPDCLQRIVDAFKRHPECGFAFGDAAEVYETDNSAHWYGWDAGYRFLTYWREHVPWMNRWQNAQRTPDLNWQTIRHLVGLPNHPRAWTRDCYWLVGGHRPGLSVSDDFDLLVRTMLCTRFVRVPYLIYFQYRNHGGNNFTVKRCDQIQILCQSIERYYKDRIDDRMKQLDMPSLEGMEQKRIWTCPLDDDRWKTCTVTDWDERKTSIIVPVLPGDDRKYSKKLSKGIKKCHERNWQDVELIVVGHVSQEFEETEAAKLPAGLVRWWPLPVATSVWECVRWGMHIRSGYKHETV